MSRRNCKVGAVCLNQAPPTLTVINEVPPFRPIVSSINTYTYRLAKYRCNLQPYLPSTYSMSDTFSFLQEITIIHLSNIFMASFDVASLFTNIPRKEVIDLAVSYIIAGNTKLQFSRAVLVNMFFIATSQTHFLFTGKVVDQIDVVAMGSPLAPVVATDKNMWLQNYQGLSVPFY